MKGKKWICRVCRPPVICTGEKCPICGAPREKAIPSSGSPCIGFGGLDGLIFAPAEKNRRGRRDE